MPSTSWQELIREPTGERHVVQFYRDEGFLRDAVAAWAAAPLQRGGGAILICTPAHVALVEEALRALGLGPATLRAEGRLVFADADATLAAFMVNGLPNERSFREAIGPYVAAMRVSSDAHPELRAWGEMVDLLCKRGQKDAAMLLEEMWTRLVNDLDIRLLCSYEADNLSEHTHSDLIHDVCAWHSQLIPERDYAAFDVAVSRALVDVFGEEEAGMVRLLYAKRRSLPTSMPPSQAVLVALQEADPVLGGRVLHATRAHLEALGAA